MISFQVFNPMFNLCLAWQHLAEGPLAVVICMHAIVTGFYLCEEKQPRGILMGDLPMLLALC